MASLGRVAISAGELSGDEHAAYLVQALRLLSPRVEVRGMGAGNLRASGVDIIVDAEKSGSVMGFAPVVRAFGSVFSALSAMKKLLLEWKPDILVLVDYPDFNLRLARYAKTLGIRVFYFIPPKLWAWRTGRIKLFHRYVDVVGLIFPFEKEFFRSRGYHRAYFVGHPYADTLANESWDPGEKARFLAAHSLDPARPVLAILPGSRWFEIERHLPAALEVARRIQRSHPELQCALAVAPAINTERLRSRLPPELKVTIVEGGALTLMRAATAGLLKSGTSNLQAAFIGLPAMMFYTAPRVSEFIVRNFVKLKEYSLPNIIRPHTVKEETGAKLDIDLISTEVESLLFDNKRRSAVLASYKEIVLALGTPDPLPLFSGAKDAYDRAARLIIDATTSNTRALR